MDLNACIYVFVTVHRQDIMSPARANAVLSVHCTHLLDFPHQRTCIYNHNQLTDCKYYSYQYMKTIYDRSRVKAQPWYRCSICICVQFLASRVPQLKMLATVRCYLSLRTNRLHRYVLAVQRSGKPSTWTCAPQKKAECSEEAFLRHVPSVALD